MSTFEVIRGVEGCCLALDDTRIAGPKPWGGGTVVHSWETDKDYGVLRGECEFKPFKGPISDTDKIGNRRGVCSECSAYMHEQFKFCPNCGAKVVDA